jgi:hypothetical protein
MSRQTTILLVGAAIGAGLLAMSSASAAPASGTAIRDAASVGDLTQKVIWRGRAWGWRGGLGWRAGWRGQGWRGYGWRPGWRVGRAGWGGWGGWGWRAGLLGVGLATATAYNYGYGGYPYDYGYGDGWGGYGWRPGWRVGWGGWGPGWGGWGPGWGGGWRVGWRPGWRFAAAW